MNAWKGASVLVLSGLLLRFLFRAILLHWVSAGAIALIQLKTARDKPLWPVIVRLLGVGDLSSRVENDASDLLFGDPQFLDTFAVLSPNLRWVRHQFVGVVGVVDPHNDGHH